jgi:hypothetical protein
VIKGAIDHLRAAPVFRNARPLLHIVGSDKMCFERGAEGKRALLALDARLRESRRWLSDAFYAD